MKWGYCPFLRGHFPTVWKGPRAASYNIGAHLNHFTQALLWCLICLVFEDPLDPSWVSIMQHLWLVKPPVVSLLSLSPKTCTADGPRAFREQLHTGSFLTQQSHAYNGPQPLWGKATGSHCIEVRAQAAPLADEVQGLMIHLSTGGWYCVDLFVI